MNNLNNTLIAGPWIGEFGWEMFAWQGYMRALSRHFRRTIIICRSGSKDIYKDFADEYVFCDKHTGMVDSFYMHGFDINTELRSLIMENELHLNENITVCPPRRIGLPPSTHYTESATFGNISIIPEYIIFNGNTSTSYDYVFHARNRDLRSEDNWSVNKWQKLLKLLGGKVASIGSKTESLLIEGTDDLRGVDLQTTFGVIGESKCVFGPSSGPMHMSSLCNTPHVVWSRPENRVRYEENWNPHKTPVLFLDEHSWHPDAEYVYQKYTTWKEQI